jgi:L-amino acid N-acyltransferase YncA
MLRIESAGPECGIEVIPLLKSYPFKPYRAYRHLFGEDPIDAYFLDSVLRSLSRPYATGYVAYSSAEVRGLLVWSPLDFESSQFGFRAGKVDHIIAAGDYVEQSETKEALLRHMLSKSTAEQLRHFCVRVDSADLASLHALQRSGFLVVDGLITYGRDLRSGRWQTDGHNDFVIRQAIVDDLTALKELASNSFSLDRFHSDPALPKATSDRIHALWVENSVLGGKDQVLVAIDELGLLGYSVFKSNPATLKFFGEPFGVWVIAAVAKRQRATGVAKSLCFAMFDWFQAHGVNLVEGGTQLANVPSARLHESCGYRVVSTNMSLSRYHGGDS